MSYQQGVPITPVFATTSMPGGTVMVNVQQRQPVIVGQVVQRPQFIQAQPISHIVGQPMIHANVGHQMVSPAMLNQVQIQAAAAADENVKTVTVFVGSITGRASDALIRQVLMKCGAVHTWKRVQGPDGKLQAFGFCAYKDPESALRAIEVLNGYLLGEKKLKIKVDSKTQKEIDEWKESKGEGYKISAIQDSKNMLASLLLEYTEELGKPKDSEERTVEKAEPPKKAESPVKVKEPDYIDEKLNELDIDDDKKEDIGNEIRSFRETQRKADEKKRKEKKEKSRTRERSRRRRSPTPPRRSVGRTSSSRRRSPPRRSPARRSPARRSPARRRSRSPVRRRREERRSRSPRKRRSRSTSIVLRYMDGSDEEADAHEKRRLERKIKEKEKNYQERLRLFEMRERRKKRELENLEEKRQRERKEMEREAKRLRDFLADYDDDKCDQKFYQGSALFKRKSERDLEIAADLKDRKKEHEELELLKKKLIEENHENVEGVLNKMKLVSENAWKPLLEPDSPSHPSQGSSTKKGRSEEKSKKLKRKRSSSVEDTSSSNESDNVESSVESEEEMQVEEEEVEAASNENIMTTETSTVVISSSEFDNPQTTPHQAVVMQTQVSKEATPEPENDQQVHVAAFKPISLKTDSNKSTPTQEAQKPMVITKRPKLKVSEMFNEDEDEDEKPKKRKFAPFGSKEKEVAKTNLQDKKQKQRELIESIPSDKAKLFAYPLDWGVVDDSLMNGRIKPWVNKKIVQYIGEEESTLVDFICDKIKLRYPPDKIQQDITMVLDDEAEVFVMKMWRLLIFEIEAKKRDISI